MPCGGSLIVANGLARPGACAAVVNLLSVAAQDQPGEPGGDRGGFSMVLLYQKTLILSTVFEKKFSKNEKKFAQA